MSLQVWLPLNGNLQNKGLSNISVTNNGATVNNNGKIGKCYSFGGSNYLTLPISLLENFTGDISCTAWINISNWNTQFDSIVKMYATNNAWQNSIFAMGRNSTTHKLYFSIANGSTSTQANCTLTEDASLNTWYHMACIYDSINKNMKIYLNGELKITYNTTITPAFNKVTSIGVGGSPLAAYGLKGLLNDFRIYNHALSQKEIKEISKALVLHYPLDDKYIESTTNLCNGLVAGGRTTVINNTIVNTGANADTYWYIKPKEALVGGATYTVSCYLSGFSSNSTYISWGVCAQSGANSAGSWKCYNGYNEFTFTMPSNLDGSTANIIFDDNGGTRTEIFTISQIQLEKKDHATGYIPFGTTRNENIVYDTSGYENNGVIGGTLTITKLSPRYDIATNFNGNSYILTPENSFSWFNFDQCTISLWIKPTINPGSWIGSVGIAHNNSSTYKSFAISNYSGKFTVNSANGSWVNITSSDLPINEWHHCVATLNTGIIKMYLDGVLVKTYTIDWKNTTVASDTRVQVGIDLPGSDEVFTGYYSDIRIYTTELSEEDILQLYQTPATIDRKQNLYIRELVEI